MFKHHLPRASSLLCVVLGCILMTRAATFDSYSLGFVSGVFCALSLVIPLPVFICMKSRIISQNRVNLAEVILVVNPGFDTKQWDKVAYEINKILNEENNWNTPLFFFNGLHCFDIFRSYILTPYFQGKFNETEKNVIRLAVNQYLQAINAGFVAFLEEDLPELPSKPKSLPNFCRKPKMGFLLTYLPRGLPILSVIQSGYYMFEAGAYHNPWLLFLSAYLLVFSYFLDKICSKDNLVALKRRELYSKLNVESKLKFLAAIVCAGPGGDLYAWNNIAQCMNQYLHDEGIWKTEDENFFDGKDCLEFFTTDLQPLVSEHNNARYPELRDLVIEAVNVCES